MTDFTWDALAPALIFFGIAAFSTVFYLLVAIAVVRYLWNLRRLRAHEQNDALTQPGQAAAER